MKSTVESSAISRSQSEVNSEKGKSHLIQATTKFDSFFHVYDQVCNKSRLPSFVYFFSAFYLYFQIFFSSLYPFNKYWITVNQDREQYTANSKIIQAFSILEYIAWLFRVEDRKLDSSLDETNGQTDLKITAILICCIFCYSLLSIGAEMLGAFRLHTVKKLSFYNLRLGFTLMAPLLLLPIAAFFGVAIRNLALGGSKISILYLFFGGLMFFICTVYSYVGQIFLNQSTNFQITCLSSFSMKIPLLLPVVSSFTILLQGVFSFFDNWTTIIIQIAHIVIGAFFLSQVVYMVYHSKLGNIMLIGIILTTWFNDIIFIFLYFMTPPSKYNDDKSVHDGFVFYYSAGFILPIFSFIISHIISYLFVTIRTSKVLKELTQLSNEIESINEFPNNNNNDNNDRSPLEELFHDSKLFKNEQTALMSIHYSFLNCLPLFYKWSAINYTLSLYPSTDAQMQIVHYLSFFPGASRKMNNVLSAVTKKRDLNYHQRFLIFQIYRIKTMRQSSVSPDANHKLAELKNLTAQAFENIYSFWNTKTANVNYLEMISNENLKLDNKWDEAIREFPNHQKFCEEYCTYLVECQMDLKRALVMRHRSNLMEMGRNFTIDVPFISLARNLPNYLEYGIVDCQGNFVNKHREQLNASANGTSSDHSASATSSARSGSMGSNNSDSGFSSNSSMLSNYKLDPEFEESIGRQLFKQAALRLEMNRSLSERHSYVTSLLLFAAFVILLTGFAIFTGLYIYIDNYITDKNDSMYYLNLASKTRFNLDLSILGTTLKFAYYSNRFSKIDLFNSLDTKDDHLRKKDKKNNTIVDAYDADMFNIDDQISENLIHRSIKSARVAFNQLLIDLYLKGQNTKENLYEFGHVLMHSEVPFYSCFEGIPGKTRNLTLKELYVYMFLIVEQSAAKVVSEGTWFSSDEICEIFANQPGLETSTLKLFTTLMQHEVDLCDFEDKYINSFTFVFPFVPFILYLIPLIVLTGLFIIDSNKITNILLNVSQEAKEEAKKPILRDSSIEIDQQTEKKTKNTQYIILFIIVIILCATSALLLYFMLSETKELNDDVKKMGRWNLLASIRMANSIETMSYTLTAVILNGSSSLNLSSSPEIVTTRKNMIKLARESIVKLQDSNEALLQGNDVAVPSTGFDEQLDMINTNPSCDVINDNETDMHYNYRCASASQGVNLFISMVELIIDDIEKTGGNFDTEMIIHSLHLMNRHLLERLEQAVDRINTINLEICKTLENKLIAIYVCGLVVTLIAFITALIFYAKSIFVYNVAMFLAQRLPPLTFFSNKKLHNFILNRKESKEESEMSTSQSVIFMSLDAIVCTNTSGVVEIINPAVTEILGYTPDQMLGQSISNFFASLNEGEEEQQQNQEKQTTKPEENDQEENKQQEKIQLSDSERITNQLELMKNGQSALVFEEHYSCLTDDDQVMPCGVTILAMTEHDSNNVESFVFILRDETQLMQQQKEAEAAKAQSENLLFQILPRDIVARLNSGEKDISFTVQSASIIFTDVVKFSEYASGLSPQEIMGSLSTMFAAFDVSAKKYDLITKIKLIGDIYMAAAGLFADENVTPKDHASQIIYFGLDCLVELEEVNIKLNANLQLRVGANTGGPLLAGVLGTDKPVFDIIGDPINVAARLQTTDVPGKIQIPKSTYDLICEEDFKIEERGEVFLKGKGKSMAYLISPNVNNNNLLDPSSSVPLF